MCEMCDAYQQAERAKFVYWNFEKMINENAFPTKKETIWELYYKLANIFSLMSRRGFLTAEQAIDKLLKFSFGLRDEYAVYYFNNRESERLSFEEWVKTKVCNEKR